MFRSPQLLDVLLEPRRDDPGGNTPFIARTTPRADFASTEREKEANEIQPTMIFLLGQKQFQEASTALARSPSEAGRQSSGRIAVWVLARNEDKWRGW
jgi:hypothetical protein